MNVVNNDDENIMWSPADYKEAAVIARLADDEIIARLNLLTIKPKIILDVGCGTGELSARLAACYQEAKVFAMDLSEAMIVHAKQQNAKVFCANASVLPLANQSIDLIVANLLLPWHAHPEALFQEWRRILRPNGVLIFTALGLDTLREWREVVGDLMLPRLVDMHDIGDFLQKNFLEPVLDVDYYTISYGQKEKFINELVASGMIKALDDLKLSQINANADNKYVVTYEVIYGHAFMPEQKTQTHLADGSISIPLSQLRQRLRDLK